MMLRVSPAVLILLACVSLFSFPLAHGIHLMELEGQQVRLLWQMAGTLG